MPKIDVAVAQLRDYLTGVANRTRVKMTFFTISIPLSSGCRAHFCMVKNIVENAPAFETTSIKNLLLWLDSIPDLHQNALLKTRVEQIRSMGLANLENIYYPRQSLPIAAFLNCVGFGLNLPSISPFKKLIVDLQMELSRTLKLNAGSQISEFFRIIEGCIVKMWETQQKQGCLYSDMKDTDFLLSPSTHMTDVVLKLVAALLKSSTFISPTDERNDFIESIHRIIADMPMRKSCLIATFLRNFERPSERSLTIAVKTLESELLGLFDESSTTQFSAFLRTINTFVDNVWSIRQMSALKAMRELDVDLEAVAYTPLYHNIKYGQGGFEKAICHALYEARRYVCTPQEQRQYFSIVKKLELRLFQRGIRYDIERETVENIIQENSIALKM